jgi:hypothetical protein
MSDSEYAVRRLSDLSSEFPALARPVMSVQQPAWRVLSQLNGSVEVVDGWCLKPSFDKARHATSVWLESHADRQGASAPAEFPGVEPRSANAVEDWLTYCGYRLQGRRALLGRPLGQG